MADVESYALGWAPSLGRFGLFVMYECRDGKYEFLAFGNSTNELAEKVVEKGCTGRDKRITSFSTIEKVILPATLPRGDEDRQIEVRPVSNPTLSEFLQERNYALKGKTLNLK